MNLFIGTYTNMWALDADWPPESGQSRSPNRTSSQNAYRLVLPVRAQPTGHRRGPRGTCQGGELEPSGKAEGQGPRLHYTPPLSVSLRGRPLHLNLVFLQHLLWEETGGGGGAVQGEGLKMPA